MTKWLHRAILASLIMASGTTFAQSDDGPFADGRPSNAGRQPTLIIDPNNYPAVTRFIFLESKTDTISREYAKLLGDFVNSIAAQPGFRASMTLADIDRKRAVVYYQFNTQAQYDTLRANAPESMKALANSLQNASARFEDFGAAPMEQLPAASLTNPPAPADGYYAEFRYGNGVGINEAVANPGRTQAEVTTLMRHAGIAGAVPTDAPGFKEFTFHMGIGTDRNMNLLRYETLSNMTVAAVYPLAQGLINGGGTGGYDWYGPTGPAKLGLHVYRIVNINDGSRRR